MPLGPSVKQTKTRPEADGFFCWIQALEFSVTASVHDRTDSQSG